MSLDYLKFVEEHANYKDFNIFEKVLMATKRAKDLYEMEKAYSIEDEKEKRKIRKKSIAHKPTYRAILEINDKKVKVYYPTEEELTTAKEKLEAENSVSDDETLLSNEVKK